MYLQHVIIKSEITYGEFGRYFFLKIYDKICHGLKRNIKSKASPQMDKTQNEPHLNVFSETFPPLDLRFSQLNQIYTEET